MVHTRPDLDLNAVDDKSKTALHILIEKCHDGDCLIEMARSILARKDYDKSIQNDIGDTILHLLVKVIVRHDIYFKRRMELLEHVMKHPDIKQCAKTLNHAKMSALDILLMADRHHSYDLEITPFSQRILDILLTEPSIINASGRSLVLAATFACPSVLQELVKNGGDVNKSLADGESAVHAIVHRNSMDKLSIIMCKSVDLTKAWKGLTPVDMAESYGCKRELKCHLSKGFGNCEHHEHLDPEDTTNALPINPDSLFTNWGYVKKCTPSKLSRNSNNIKLSDNLIIHVIKHNRVLFATQRSEVELIKSSIDTLV